MYKLHSTPAAEEICTTIFSPNQQLSVIAERLCCESDNAVDELQVMNKKARPNGSEDLHEHEP